VGAIDDEFETARICEASVYFVLARTIDAEVIDPIRDFIDGQEHYNEGPSQVADPKNLNASGLLPLVDDSHLGEATIEVGTRSRIRHWHCHVRKPDVGHISYSAREGAASRRTRFHLSAGRMRPSS
jgi:hypothetical protein